MSKPLPSIILLLFAIPSLAQVSGVVVEADTKKPVPYVNIGSMAEGYGTSSSAKGRFTTDTEADDSLAFSAVGFATKTMAVGELSDTVMLEKQVSQLKTAEIRPEASKELILGEYKGNRIRYFWGTSNYVLLVARHFAYPSETSEVLFLNRLSIYTESELEGAKFIVRIYGVGLDGKPGEYLCDQNIFGYAKKGWQETEVDLSDLHIVFPEEGLFIAVESLRIEENRYTQVVENQSKRPGLPKNY
ncbi:MAG: carboxypeptidase-like regulatory domain-containing protein, partial [Cryomorphaceae bacterium]